MTFEIWKTIDGFPGYEVSSLGNIRSPRGLMKIQNGPKGYKQIGMYSGEKTVTKRVHKLVATAFLPNPLRLPSINHIDCNKSNNSVENLEWCSVSENHKHAYKNGLMKRRPGELHPLSKISNHQTSELRRAYASGGITQKELGLIYGLTQSAVNRIINGNRRSYGINL